MSIGKKIKEFRLANGLKAKELAALIGISQGSLSDIENENTAPSAETLEKIFRNTDIKSEQIFERKGGFGVLEQTPGYGFAEKTNKPSGTLHAKPIRVEDYENTVLGAWLKEKCDGDLPTVLKKLECCFQKGHLELGMEFLTFQSRYMKNRT